MWPVDDPTRLTGRSDPVFKTLLMDIGKMLKFVVNSISGSLSLYNPFDVLLHEGNVKNNSIPMFRLSYTTNIINSLLFYIN